jgi:hypothetical protein
MSQEDEELVKTIGEILAKDELEQQVSPLIREAAKAQLAGMEGPQLDSEWENWKMGDFYKSKRDRRLQILQKWEARLKGPPYSTREYTVWADHKRELDELHELLERAGR